MFLQSIKVENYRAIQKGQLSLDKSIAVIGENDSGKTSLLDALNKCLSAFYLENPFIPDKKHFYHKPGAQTANGPIRIELEFIERYPKEWNGTLYLNLQDLLVHRSNVKNRFILSFRTRYSSDSSVQCEWMLRNPVANKTTSDPTIIDGIRKLNPIIHLSAGLLTGRGLDKLEPSEFEITKNTFPDKLQEHVKQVKECANKLLSGNSIHHMHDVEKGYQSALELNEYLAAIQPDNGISLDIRKKDTRRKGELLRSGSNSEKLGTLLIMNALIEVCGSTILSEVDPIWVIEDPEAHLHKMTLASVTNIIKGINGQKVITTNSGGLLANIPLHQVRRLQRNEGVISEYYMPKNSLSKDDIRRVNYHVRTHRNSAFFSRVWLLVEGETEFWILPRLARVLGYDFRLEGITCVEYAQSGLRPLLRIAEKLNIQWLMLSDGDNAGYKYANQARHYNGKSGEGQICVFPARDIEHYLWENGFDDVYIRLSRTRIPRERLNAGRTIKSAIRNYSKPHLALSIIEAASGEKGIAVPGELVRFIEDCVKVAREQ